MNDYKNLSISVGEVLNVPNIMLSGRLSGWHDSGISALLSGYKNDSVSTIVLDVANLDVKDQSGAEAIIKSLRNLGSDVCVHVVCSGMLLRLLEEANLSQCIRLYSSTDEISKYLMPNDEYYTSRSIADDYEGLELPRAA